MVTLPRHVEPARVEWFLAGTEPQTAAQLLATGHPRIVAPAPGTIIALDPDIPASRQRMVFEAQDGGGSARWVLDGTDLGYDGDLVVWKPEPGTHNLSLVDEGGQLHDRITFEVRGGTPVRSD